MGLSIHEFRECLVQAGQVRLLPIAHDYPYNDWRPSAARPCWRPAVGRLGVAHDIWLMVATILTLIVVPSLYAIFVENFKISPVPQVIKNRASDSNKV